MEVTAPTSGEFLKIGSSVNVEWDAADNSGTIASRAIYFSEDGSDWELVDSADGNTGSYAWIVPNVTSDDCKIRVNAYDPFGNKGTGESDAFMVGATGIFVDIQGSLSNNVSYINQNGMIFLSIPSQIDYALDIYNSTGRCMVSEKGFNAGIYNLSKMLQSGHYVIKVRSQNENYMKPIIINK